MNEIFEKMCVWIENNHRKICANNISLGRSKIADRVGIRITELLDSRNHFETWELQLGDLDCF
jgi:hypothetical protein